MRSDMTPAEIAALIARANAYQIEARDCGPVPVNLGEFLQAQQETIARLREALADAEEVLSLAEHPALPDPAYHTEVKALGQRIGFGALMKTASAGWMEANSAKGYPTSGAFVAGPCIGTVQGTLARIRAALSTGEQP